MAAREPARRCAERLVGEAARRGALEVVGWRGAALDGGGYEALLRPVVIVGDGARWIWDEVAASFGGERTAIIDWCHAAEHLGTVATALFGEGIRFAIRAGRLAGEVGAAAVRRGDVSAPALAAYEAEWRRRVGWSHRLAYEVNKIL